MKWNEKKNGGKEKELSEKLRKWKKEKKKTKNKIKLKKKYRQKNK